MTKYRLKASVIETILVKEAIEITKKNQEKYKDGVVIALGMGSLFNHSKYANITYASLWNAIALPL